MGPSVLFFPGPPVLTAMRTKALVGLILLATLPGCRGKCDCPDDESLLNFNAVGGEFDADSYEIDVWVDGGLRTSCSSSFGVDDETTVMCDDPDVEVIHGRTAVVVRLPEFEEGVEVGVELRDGLGSVWTGSLMVETRFYDSLDKCVCLFGSGVGEVSM